MPYQQWQFRMGLHGLAILRIGTAATDEQLAEHLTALATPLAATESALTKIIGGTERDVTAGYARWAPVYDAPGNPLIAHEEPVAHEIFASWPTSLRVLDVPCGTGRHAAYLAGLGHDVTGVDGSPAMLAEAARKLPGLTLIEGKIESLPFEIDEFDAAVCALLFDHLPRVDQAIAELARVVRPGGHIMISNIHPTMAIVGAHAAFRDANDDSNFIRSYHHPVSTYLRLFRENGLTVVGSEEPCWTAETAQAQFAFVSDAARRDAVVGLPMALIWELVA